MTAVAFDPAKAPALDPSAAKPPEFKSGWAKVSPSQIVAYKQCPRRWYNASILYDREPSKGFQLKGDAVHKALEVYMSTGEVLPSVEMEDPNSPTGKTVFSTLEFVQVARDFLPPPITDEDFWGPHKTAEGGIMVEQEGALATFEDGPDLVQFIDLVCAYAKDVRYAKTPPDGVLSVEVEAPGAPRHADAKAPALINDYKTTSDFRYAKTPEEVKNDTQLNINAKWLFAVSDYEEIELRLLYLNTKLKTPKAKPVSVVVTRADVEKVWARDMAIVREMAAWAKLRPETADPLPPNTESCDLYGGCFYRTKCFGAAAPSAGASSLFSINRHPSTSTLPPKGSPMSTPAVTPAAIDPNSTLGRLMNMAKAGAPGAAAPAPAAPAPAAAPSPTPPALFAKAPTAAAPAAPVGVVAPAAPAPASPPPGLASLFKKPVVAPAAPAPAAAAPAPAPVEAPAPKTTTVQVSPEEYERLKAAPALSDAAIMSGDVGIRPPDAPSPISTPEEVAAANPVEAPAAAEAPVAEAAPAGAPVEAPKRRGRPPKAAVEASAPAAAPVAPPVEAPAPVAEAAAAPAPAAPVVPPVDGTVEQMKAALVQPDASYVCPVQVLFIDCLPAKGFPMQPQPLSEFMAGFERAAAASAKALDYRLIRYESKGYLALAIRTMMRALPEAIYIDTRLPGADIFESVVTPYAAAVFRGTR